MNEDSVRFLQTCFEATDISVLEKALHECQGDVDMAIDYILTQIALDDEPIAVSIDTPNLSIDDKLACLVGVFDIDERVAMGTLQHCRFDLDKAIEQLSLADSRSAEASGSVSRSKQRPSSNMHPPTTISTSSNNLTSIMSRPVQTPAEQLVSLPSTSTTRSYAQTASELRQIASDLISERNERYHRAAQAYKRGGQFGGGIAAYYSEQGHALNQRAQDVNMVAARKLVEAQRPIARSNSGGDDESRYWIDLHGVRVAEALVIVSEELSGWYQRETSMSQKSIIAF